MTLSSGSGQSCHARFAHYAWYVLSGDFDVVVDYDLVTYPNSSYWGLDLVVWDEEGEGGSMVRGWYGQQEYRTWENNSGWQGTGNTTTDTVGKLRFTRVGTQWTTYWWNGSSWSQNHTWSAGIGSPVSIEMSLLHGNTDPACEANWIPVSLRFSSRLILAFSNPAFF